MLFICDVCGWASGIILALYASYGRSCSLCYSITELVNSHRHTNLAPKLPHGPGRTGRLLIDALSDLRPSHHLLVTNYPSQAVMSSEPSTSSSQSDFASIFNAALETYKRKTKKDLASDPLLSSLQSCDSPEAILTVLRDRIPAFSQSRNVDDGLTKWVTPTVNVLYAFSATLGQGVGLVSI